MFKTLILILVFIFLISPMLSLIHELSHALLPLTKGEEVIVKVGVNPVVDFKIKNFSLKIGFLKPWLGFTSWSGENTIGRLLLGPLASLILAISFYFLSQTNIEYKSVIIASMWWCTFQFLFTVWPVKYPIWLGYNEQDSDGLQIIQLLKKN